VKTWKLIKSCQMDVLNPYLSYCRGRLCWLSTAYSSWSFLFFVSCSPLSRGPWSQQQGTV